MLRRNSALIGLARPFYRHARTQYLRWRHRAGGFIDTTGVPVFCDFRHPSYVWYDADSAYLRFHKSVLQALVRHSRGSVFVDVGAHFGFYTALLAQMMTAASRPGTIIAVEPDPHHVECLRRTASRCRTDAVTVEVVPAALGDHDGSIALYRTAASCLHSYFEKGAVACDEVPLLTMDSLLEARNPRGSRVALIKVDVDGAEGFVMDGWTRTIEAHQPLVLIEFCPSALQSANRDPRELFAAICRRFVVAHIDHLNERIVSVGPGDYDALARTIGSGVTDLALSAHPLAGFLSDDIAEV